MFSGCTSLTKAPDLLARNVPSYCYENMFYGCSSLNYVKMMASVFGLQSNWLQGVSSTGTFIKNSALYCEDSDLGIPDGWVLEAEEEIGNFHKGHEYVDLGLPSGTLWATCNIDVKGHLPIPNRSGYFLAWGEIETKDRFGNSYPYSGRYTEDGEVKYYDWGQDIRNTDHDIVHLIWEGDWSIPSTDDFAELINNCTWDWEPLNGTNGYKVTSKVNDNWIFLPVSGYKAQSHYNSYDGGYYWSSELDTDDISKSFALVFSSSQVTTSSFDRDKGLVVRPVIRVNK